MERNSFIFYKSFYDAFKGLEPELRLKCYDLISEYALLGIEPGQEDAIINMVFTLVRPQIDANNRRYENGCKGGRPRKNAAIAANSESANVAAMQPKKTRTKKYKNLLSLEPKEEAQVKEPEQEVIEQPSDEDIKHNYGANGNVLLSDADYTSLVANKGESEVKEAIEILDIYIESLDPAAKRKYKKKNHRACMYTWVFDRVAENKAKRERLKPKAEQPRRKVNNFLNFPQNEYDYDELERKLLEN